MKNKISVTLLMVMMMILLAAATAACSATAQETEVESVTAEAGQAGSFSGELSALNSLMVVVLSLENGEQALTAEQAGDMLPLWKLARSMNESSNVAAEELDALAEQISESLTEEQNAAIAEMEISAASQRELMQEYGVSFSGGQGGEDRPEGFQRPDGGIPGSGPGGGAGGTGLSPDQIATMQAERAGFSRSGLNPMLLEVLIELLEDKVNG